MDCPDVTMMILVHNAFRRDLARMRLAAEEQESGPVARIALRSGWATFTRYLGSAEDKMLWPPMRTSLANNATATNVLAAMVSEHAQLDPVLHEIETELAEESPTRLVTLFCHLETVLSAHLDHEETAALPAGAGHPHCRPMGGVRRRPAPPYRPRRRGRVLPWLLDSAPPDARDRALQTLPRPLRLVCKLIWEPRYRRRSPWRGEHYLTAEQ